MNKGVLEPDYRLESAFLLNIKFLADKLIIENDF